MVLEFSSTVTTGVASATFSGAKEVVGVTVLVVGAGPVLDVGLSVDDVVGLVEEVVGLSVFPQPANNITEVSTNKAKDFFIAILFFRQPECLFFSKNLLLSGLPT